jgi:hypothetical protein
MIELIGLTALFLFLTLSTVLTPPCLLAPSANATRNERRSLDVGPFKALSHSRTELRPNRPTVTRPRARGFVFCASRTTGEIR